MNNITADINDNWLKKFETKIYRNTRIVNTVEMRNKIKNNLLDNIYWTVKMPLLNRLIKEIAVD
jgi:hypothetical protein